MTRVTSATQAAGKALLIDQKRVHRDIPAGKQETIFHTADDAEVGLQLGRGSEVHYIFFCRSGNATLRSTLADSAHVYWHIFTFGSGSYELHSELVGPNAVSQIDWVFRAGKKEKQTIDIHNIFSAKNGGGEIVLKGVAEDHAHVVCNGMIKIGLQGGGTKTHLTEDVLMLDSTAKVDAIPGLEIKTNDVKASHSATVSRVTPEQLFYLQSRGLPEEVARKLFIDGFLGEMIGGIPLEFQKKVLSVLL